MEYKDAAEVCEKVSVGGQVSSLLTRAAHLAAIHKLPPATWAEAVAHMVKADWSAPGNYPLAITVGRSPAQSANG